MQNVVQSPIPPDSQDEPWYLGSAARRMTVPGVALVVVGLVLALLVRWDSPLSFSILKHAYLVAFTFYLSITLGALFFVMLHHLTRTGWSVTLRRLAEALSGNIGLMALLFLPLFFFRIGMEVLDTSETHAAASSGLTSRIGMESLGTSAAHTEASTGLTVGVTQVVTRIDFSAALPFLLRFVIYFAIWGFLAWYLHSRSVRQDADGDVGLTRAMERVSAPGMIAFGLTVTFAAIDLLMSLTSHWHSTIIGVYFFTDSVLSGFVVLMLFAYWLQRNGLLRAEITAARYHDLGKYIFAFVFFWGYIAFSQYLLIWYANMPEETQFYMPRQIGSWAAVSIVLVVFHLVIPFVGLLSRHAKRRTVLAFWAIWLLAAHLLDLFWFIMPTVFIEKIAEAVGAAPGTPLPEALKELLASPQSVYQVAEKHQGFMQSVEAPLEPFSVAVVLGLVMLMGGLYMINTARLLRKAALVPLADPRLDESLALEST